MRPVISGARYLLAFFSVLAFPLLSLAANPYPMQTFSSGAPNWVAASASQTWTATGGYYRNGSTQLHRDIAYYNGDTWATNFTYKLRMYSDLDNGGVHRLGAVFNYTDSANYYEVLIRMSDGDPATKEVEVARTQNGARTLVTSGPASNVTRDVWFDVTIVRTGNNVTVRIGPDVAINNASLGATAPAGRVGVFSQFNNVRFDDVSVALAAPPLFSSGFGNGVSITPVVGANPATRPECIGPGQPPDFSQKKYQLNVVGTEPATGTTWPPSFWGTMSNVRMMNTILPCSFDFSDYLYVQIESVADGPTGTPSRVLVSKVIDVEPPANDGNPARLGLSYTPDDATATIPNRFYVRRYLKYSSDVLNLGPHDWFVQHEYKARDCNLPRRLILYWHSNGSGAPYYRLLMDRSNNCSIDLSTGEDLSQPIPNRPNVQLRFDPIFEERCFTESGGGPCPDFPVDDWFYDEYFVQYSANGTAQDRVAYAINGEVIFDVRQPIASSPHRGIKLTPGYTNIPNVEVQVDDVEVFGDLPCADFPCGTPPTHHPD